MPLGVESMLNGIFIPMLGGVIRSSLSVVDSMCSFYASPTAYALIDGLLNFAAVAASVDIYNFLWIR